MTRPPRAPRRPELAPIVQAAIAAAEDRKAQDLVVLDLRGLADATDWFLIASGTSDAHVRGIADRVQERMLRAGYRAHHVEGLGGKWVLLDYIDVVVHLFHPEARAFYQLERLWNDAPAVHPDAGGTDR